MPTTHPPSPTTSRRRLLDAAWGLLAAEEDIPPTVAEIARRAGVSRPTVYAAFPDVPQLLGAAAIDRLATALEPRGWLRRGDSADPQTWLTRTFTAVLEELAPHRRAYQRVLTGPGAEHVQRGTADYLARRLLTDSPVAAALHSGPLPPETAATALAAGVVRTAADRITADGDLDIPGLASTLALLLDRGVHGGLGSRCPGPAPTTRSNEQTTPDEGASA